jgi:hypothetical protein
MCFLPVEEPGHTLYDHLVTALDWTNLKVLLNPKIPCSYQKGSPQLVVEALYEVNKFHDTQ